MRIAIKGFAALLLFAIVDITPLHGAESGTTQVLFVCEHGYAKSLMAASYFDQLAKARGLPFRALSRGSAPKSMTVPPGIVAALRSDGIDVGEYVPLKVSVSDLASSKRVVLMSTALPTSAGTPTVSVEQWDDVPPPLMYDASRASIKAHINKLLDELSQSDRE